MDREKVTGVPELIGLAFGGHESDAEELRVGARKLWNVGGYLAFEIRAVFLMQLP